MIFCSDSSSYVVDVFVDVKIIIASNIMNSSWSNDERKYYYGRQELNKNVVLLKDEQRWLRQFEWSQKRERKKKKK